VGEAALVEWGSGPYADQGWIRYKRHGRRGNYSCTDGHAETLPWSKARYDQFLSSFWLSNVVLDRRINADR
jgi:prepilin-type processing-associated H-X9-DG protein